MQELLKPLGQVLREVRREADVLQVDVAVRAQVSRTVLSRLETGARWPEAGPDRLLAAYAQECGVSPIQLWKRAVAQADAEAASK